MGAGAYGNSGLNPPVSFHMWKTFALPRMLYGLEVFNLKRSDTVQLESIQKSILRRLQYLPNNTANVAVYCLLGARSIEQEIDYKKKNFLYSLPSLTVRTLSSSSLLADKWLSKAMTAIAGLSIAQYL